MSDMDYRRWHRRRIGETCVEALKKHGFDAHFAETEEKAKDLCLKLAEGHETFGFGGSDTTRSLGLVDALKKKGKTVYDHWQPELTPEADMKIRRAQLACDCFVCSANAISAGGEIVNVDGIGNRTSAMAFGPKQVIVVAGMNKVVPDLHAALRRVKEVAAPMRAKSLNMKTPCAETGVCSDCNAPQRICRVTTILHRRPMKTAVAVVLINAEMGF
jgi:L-lactate utilization protein LutB